MVSSGMMLPSFLCTVTIIVDRAKGFASRIEPVIFLYRIIGIANPCWLVLSCSHCSFRVSKHYVYMWIGKTGDGYLFYHAHINFFSPSIDLYLAEEWRD